VRLLAAALGVTLAVLAGSALGHSAPAQPDAVSLHLSTYRNVNGVLVLVFAGTVSSGSAGQTVEVTGQDCGGQGFRALAAAQTRPGGGWRLENPESTAPYRTFPWSSGTTFRARWNDDVSEPVALRFPAPISASKVSGRRAWRVFVSSTSLVNMAGRIVELQRRTGSAWVRYRTARLVHKASFDRGPYNNEAVFNVPARNLRLRAYLPRASALPCWLPAATAPWRS
jgi:hypothetical protein